MLDVEAQLAQLVPAEGELLRGGPLGHGLEPLADLGHVLGLPVLGVGDEGLPLVEVDADGGGGAGPADHGPGRGQEEDVVVVVVLEGQKKKMKSGKSRFPQNELDVMWLPLNLTPIKY